MADQKTLQQFLASVSRKLALLVGGSVFVSTVLPGVGNAELQPPQAVDNGRLGAGSQQDPFSASAQAHTVLKQTGSGFKMIAQHSFRIRLIHPIRHTPPLHTLRILRTLRTHLTRPGRNLGVRWGRTTIPRMGLDAAGCVPESVARQFSREAVVPRQLLVK